MILINQHPINNAQNIRLMSHPKNSYYIVAIGDAHEHELEFDSFIAAMDAYQAMIALLAMVKPA